MRHAIRLLSFCLLPLVARTQAPTPVQWHHLDAAADHTVGISTERAYALLRQLGRQPSARPVIVAVIDGGIDTAHVDLRRVLWHNPKEIAGNGQDDDHNGYVDDVYGWNFLGNKDGRNIFYAQGEDIRLYARLRPRYEQLKPDAVPKTKQAEFQLFQRAKAAYTTGRTEAEANLATDTKELTEDEVNLARLKQALHASVLDSALLHRPPTTDTAIVRLAARYHRALRGRLPSADSLLNLYRRHHADLQGRLDYVYNPTYNPQLLVGDDPNNLRERYYGNGNLAPSLHYHGVEHGTHCAGIIGADRRNALGVLGVADNARILSVRSVPNGDERDKDVANAIRYAVDNGASIISMSFGKYFSPEKEVVDEAIRYANTKGVLLVHAAGNDHLDTDAAQQFPSNRYLNGQEIPNLLTIGASGATNDQQLVASFSNYGRQSVDVFAPGVGIWSTIPVSQYGPMSGTSMATPVVAGIAAVLKSYFPQLSPTDLKRIILQSAVPYHTQVPKPGTKELVDFSTLSRTGGIVNLYEAVRLASAATPAAK